MIFGIDPRPRAWMPLWWRVPAWTAMTVYSIVETHGTGRRVAAGLVVGLGAVVLQFVFVERMAVRRAVLFVVTACGFAACFVAPQGLGEVLIVVIAARAPSILDGRALRAFVVADTVLFAVAVGYVSHSYAGLLAGFAVPTFVQLSAERIQLTRERDRARALLAEVQAGRESEARAAALSERGRIAREMHDVLAHSLAGLSVQLQALRAVAARTGAGPELTEPLDRAAALAREGLTEARSAVGALRDPVALGVADLAALVTRHPGTARLVAPDGLPALTPSADHAVYRAVQESLTNAARYAPGSPVVVTVSAHGRELDVTVDDDGPAPGRERVSDASTGLGLAGMSERVAEAGGRLQAGPRPTGGWRVAITVPVPDAVTPPDAVDAGRPA